MSHSADGEYIVLLHTGYEAKGVYMDAFLARPADGPTRPGVVLLSGTGEGKGDRLLIHA